MRTIQTHVYTFDELSDKAKEAARDWWRTREAQDPAWADEHADSVRAARKFIDSYRYADSISDLYETAKGFRADPKQYCPWTGYCADEVAIDAILKACADGADDLDRLARLVDHAMDKAWEAEQEYQMEDENVDENIRVNGYEFTEHGRIA